jgi:hypothetical protein
MPRTALTSHNLTDASAPGSVLADPTPAAADTTNGNSCANTGMTILRVQNTDTNPHTLTLITPGTVDGTLAVADDPRVIPASSKQFIGRLPVAVYGSTLQFTSDSTTLQITVFEP